MQTSVLRSAVTVRIGATRSVSFEIAASTERLMINRPPFQPVLSKGRPIQRLKTLPQSIRLHTHQPFEEIETVRPGFWDPMQRECNIRQISRDKRCRGANVAQGRSCPTSQGIRDRMNEKRIPPFPQEPFQPPDQKLFPSTQNRWSIQKRLQEFACMVVRR